MVFIYLSTSLRRTPTVRSYINDFSLLYIYPSPLSLSLAPLSLISCPPLSLSSLAIHFTCRNNKHSCGGCFVHQLSFWNLITLLCSFIHCLRSMSHSYKVHFNYEHSNFYIFFNNYYFAIFTKKNIVFKNTLLLVWGITYGYKKLNFNKLHL
jgi:hypothetical protein